MAANCPECGRAAKHEPECPTLKPRTPPATPLEAAFAAVAGTVPGIPPMAPWAPPRPVWADPVAPRLAVVVPRGALEGALMAAMDRAGIYCEGASADALPLDAGGPIAYWPAGTLDTPQGHALKPLLEA